MERERERLLAEREDAHLSALRELKKKRTTGRMSSRGGPLETAAASLREKAERKEREIQELQELREREQADLREYGRREIAELREESKRELAELRDEKDREAERELADLREDNERELAEMDAEHELEVARLSSELDRLRLELDRLRLEQEEHEEGRIASAELEERLQEAEEELSRTKRRHASEMTKMENRVGLHRSAKERLQSQCADMEGLL